MSNQGPSKEQSHYSDLYYTQKKTINILIHKCQWTLPNIILIRDIDMFSTYVPISANCLFVYCLLHLCIRMFIVFFVCNINHYNDSAPCWDLDWTKKNILSSMFAYIVGVIIF
jgi:hypothetical protein